MTEPIRPSVASIQHPVPVWGTPKPAIRMFSTTDANEKAGLCPELKECQIGVKVPISVGFQIPDAILVFICLRSYPVEHYGSGGYLLRIADRL